MRILAGVPPGGTSNDSRVVNDDIFIVFGGYFFGNFRDKAHLIIWPYVITCRSVIDCKMSCQNLFSY